MSKISIENFSINKSNWKKVKFGDVVFEPKESVKDPVAEGIQHVIGLEHIDSEDIHLRRSASIEESTTFTKKFSKADVLFGRRRAYLKKAAKADFEGICSGDITVMRAKDGLLPALLPFLVNNDKFFDYAVMHSAGGLSPRVKFKDLANYEFLLPPKDKQAELAELFGAADKFLRSAYDIEEKLWKLKRKISQDHYYDKEVPKQKLSELCEKIQDGSHYSPQTIYEKQAEGRYRYVTSKNIRKTGLEFKEEQYVDEEFHRTIYPRCDTRLGDILLTKDGANTGIATVNSLNEEISILSSVCMLRTNESKLSNDYLCHYLNSDIGYVNMTGKMTGTAIKRLTLNVIKNAKVPSPSIEIQNRINRKLNLINLNIDKSKMAQKNTNILTKSLVAQVF